MREIDGEEKSLRQIREVGRGTRWDQECLNFASNEVYVREMSWQVYLREMSSMKNKHPSLRAPTIHQYYSVIFIL